MTTIPLFQAIVFIILAALVGWGLGIVDARMTAKLKKNTKEDKPAAPTIQPTAEQNVAGEHTVLKVTIDKALKWHVELDGKRLEVPEQVSTEQRQRTVNVIMQIRPWIDGKPAAASPQPTPAAPQPIPASPAAQPAPVNSLQTPPPATVAQSVPSVAPVKVDLAHSLRGVLQSDTKSSTAIKSTSIVMQIDDILQTRLQGTVLMAQGVKLEEGPSGEVVVVVAANRYPGVDAVPDPEIRAVIKAAITEWEKR